MQYSIHEGEIEWDGVRITIPVQEGGVKSLVGMRLMWGYTLTVRCEENGAVTLSAIEGGDNP